MDDETGSNVWRETTGEVLRPAAWGRPSTQPTASSLAEAYVEVTNITPATDREFITILTPCLQLVAPVGMSPEAQDTWFEAARMALAQFPASLLRRGAQYAMMHADHPSKIVPLITKEIADAYQQRVRNSRGRDDAPRNALPAPGKSQCTVDEAAEICRKFKVGSFSANRPARDPAQPTKVGPIADPMRPSRVPTREDYIRLFGIDPEAAPDAAA